MSTRGLWTQALVLAANLKRAAAEREQLRAENGRLRAELATLRAELTALRSSEEDGRALAASLLHLRLVTED